MVSKDSSLITLPPFNNPNPQAQSTPQYPPIATSGPGIMYHPSHMSSPQSPPMNQGPAGGLQPYPPPPQPEANQESQASNQYPQYSYDIQLKYPQQQQENHSPHQQYNPGQGLPLPSMSTSGLPPLSQGGYPPIPGQQELAMDTTGQIAPPGSKPRVTATLWEDEDNHMINGTKLLNVAGMTRGRRDGILKAEKQKHVVKIGPMHLKGVWIPFERALEFANKEKITEMLYPLFVHNIGALLYHPINHSQGRVFPPQPPQQANMGQVPPPLQMMRPQEQGGQQRMEGVNLNGNGERMGDEQQQQQQHRPLYS
ncbi:hypothetical protein G7Y89_g1872 [Cudoniella acicularis]|uniref:HTH APSES-type domain-containing protein n=1 Tax=Cudoniella acicularis TaxID=354080 RepID=A0A8H4W7H5_9HELO|nr:hypothetical protein G7Y89_g1872 [Cudoniella acicularis]